MIKCAICKKFVLFKTYCENCEKQQQEQQEQKVDQYFNQYKKYIDTIYIRNKSQLNQQIIKNLKTELENLQLTNNDYIYLVKKSMDYIYKVKNPYMEYKHYDQIFTYIFNDIYNNRKLTLEGTYLALKDYIDSINGNLIIPIEKVSDYGVSNKETAMLEFPIILYQEKAKVNYSGSSINVNTNVNDFNFGLSKFKCSQDESIVQHKVDSGSVLFTTKNIIIKGAGLHRIRLKDITKYVVYDNKLIVSTSYNTNGYILDISHMPYGVVHCFNYFINDFRRKLR